MRLIDAEYLENMCRKHMDNDWNKRTYPGSWAKAYEEFIDDISAVPTIDAVPVPKDGIGELSDGYHTFNGLYYQRMMLFATLVKQNKGRAWKSYRHEDGELCFGGGWFIVGIDTPEGSYTYHYESKDFDLFDCEELPAGKHWDGHTEADVTRLLSLPAADVVEVVRCRDCAKREICRTSNTWAVAPSDDWFCADGERKGED